MYLLSFFKLWNVLRIIFGSLVIVPRAFKGNAVSCLHSVVVANAVSAALCTTETNLHSLSNCIWVQKTLPGSVGIFLRNSSWDNEHNCRPDIDQSLMWASACKRGKHYWTIVSNCYEEVDLNIRLLNLNAIKFIYEELMVDSVYYIMVKRPLRNPCWSCSPRFISHSKWISITLGAMNPNNKLG